MRFVLIFLLTALCAADEPAVSQWQGYQRKDFKVMGHPSHVIIPSVPAEGRPWIWRTEFFGHEPQADLALLAKGWHVAYTDLQNLYGGPAAMERMDQFHEHLVSQFHLSEKVVLEGFSRGGLFALNWAIRHPERASALYLDAPVCDVNSWPAGFGKGKRSPKDWERCKAVYSFKNDAEAMASRLCPLDNLAALADAQVPILSVCGDADQVVPLAENSEILERRYTLLGGTCQLIIKPGVDHHPHSLSDPGPIVEFILKKRRP